MTQSFSNVALKPSQWTDLTSLYPALAGGRVLVRYLSDRDARLFHGGGSAPASLTEGDILLPREAAFVAADHIWVTGEGAVSITLL